MKLAARRHGDRTAIAALVVMFALLVQLVAPASVMAAPAGAGGLVICTQGGIASLSGGSGPLHQRHSGAACQDCLAAAPALIATPGLAIQRVAYAAERVEHVATLSLVPPRARAPPRPPGQGPPTA